MIECKLEDNRQK